MGRIKRILRLCHFEFFDKGEGRHKRIQAISPLFFWKREKRDTKRIQAVSPWRILFWQREKRMKRMNSTSFQGLENQKAFGTKKKKKFKEIQGL